MSNQTSLFDLPAPERTPYARGSRTSQAAAEAAKSFVGEQGLTVLRWLVSQGSRGGTQREASEALGIGRPSMCARFRALELAGRIRKTAIDRAHCTCYQVNA